MSLHRGRREEIGQVPRSESMEASVCERAEFESDAIWHLEPVQLSSHDVRNRCSMWIGRNIHLTKTNWSSEQKLHPDKI